MDLFRFCGRKKKINAEGAEVAHRGHGEALNLLSGDCIVLAEMPPVKKANLSYSLLHLVFETHFWLRSFGYPCRVASG
jgi:hypothetical protein